MIEITDGSNIFGTGCQNGGKVILNLNEGPTVSFIRKENGTLVIEVGQGNTPGNPLITGNLELAEPQEC